MMKFSRTYSVLFFLSVCSVNTSIFFSNSQAARPEKEAEFTYVAEDAKLWTEPTRFGQAVALLKTGVELSIREYSSNRTWVKVLTPTGREGWVPTRFTTQSGRRTFPLNADLGSSKDRGPASIEAQGAVELSAPQGDTSNAWEGTLGLEYMNQLTRETTSGFGIDLSMLHRLTNSWSVGGGLSWNRFSKSAESVSTGNTTQRTSHRFSPQLLMRYRMSSFRLDLGLGYALDRSSVETRFADGSLAPAAYNGSDSESSIAIRVTPRFIFPVSQLVKVGIYVTYLMDIALSSGEGDIAGAENAVSSPYSFIGGGMSVGMDF